jgi:hypothetical protein
MTEFDDLMEDYRLQEDQERHWEAGAVKPAIKRQYGGWVRPTLNAMAIELRQDGNRLWKVIHIENPEECVVERDGRQIAIHVNDETDEWWHLGRNSKPNAMFVLGPFRADTLFAFADITTETWHYANADPSHYRDIDHYASWRYTQ